MAKHASRLSFAVLMAYGVLLISCSTTRNTQVTRGEFVPSAPRPPAPVLVEAPPPLAISHVPARDPALALAYQAQTSETILRPRRDPERTWSRRSAALMAGFQAQELRSWKQAPEALTQQPEEILMEELLRLNIAETPRVSSDLEQMLEATKSDLPLTLNDQVRRYVNYFLGRGRITLRENLRRAGAYRPMISRILDEQGVPQDLIYLVQAESGFRPRARSTKKATGMWQFVAGRGREYGLNQNRHVDERLDPEKATYAAARHLADLYAHFGDWYLAMAAYNCGPGCVQRAIERTGYADYWEMVSRRALPRETSNYVPVILAMALLAKNAGAFGMHDVVPENPIDYDTVTTHSRISLLLIADITGATAARIKQLNPALLGGATPEGAYALRIPKDTADQFQQEIALVPEARRQSWRRRQVQPNEALTQIAAGYKVRVDDIVSVNQLGQVQPVAGDRLTIPVPLRPEVVRAAAVGSLSARYRVRRGDTLASVARRYRVTVAQLRQWNGLTGTRLAVGQTLSVRAAAPATARAKYSGSVAKRQLASNARAGRAGAN